MNSEKEKESKKQKKEINSWRKDKSFA